jgi:hypothetical protein
MLQRALVKATALCVLAAVLQVARLLLFCMALLFLLPLLQVVVYLLQRMSCALFNWVACCPHCMLLLLLLLLLLQVVVYMQRQLAEPVLVYLCQPGPAPCQMHPEIVEAHSSLANIMALLQQRKLASRTFPAAAAAAAAAAASGQQQMLAPRASTHSSVASTRSSVADSSSGGGCSAGSAQGSAGSTGSAILPSCVVVKRQDGSCCSRVRVTEGCSIAELQATIQQVEVRQLKLSSVACSAAEVMVLMEWHRIS